MHAFLNAIFRAVVQHFTKFKLLQRVARSLCNSWASSWRVFCAVSSVVDALLWRDALSVRRDIGVNERCTAHCTQAHTHSHADNACCRGHSSSSSSQTSGILITCRRQAV